MTLRNLIHAYLMPLVLTSASFALPAPKEADNRSAWNLLLDNKPLEARDIFEKNAASKDLKIAGEACRGAGIIARFMGNQPLETKWVLKAFQLDRDTLALMAGQIRHLSFGDFWSAHQNKEVYEVGSEAAKHPTLLTASLVFEMARRYLNDGDKDRAEKILADLGILRQWWAVGPFSNISGSGFDKAYPPESGINLAKDYEGKNGDRVRWFPLNLAFPSSWIWMSNHAPAANAILYFTTQVESPVERKALLSFGASGSFKVFLNDKLVLAERVFRNTGTDAFVQEITLRKGSNRILVKLGNENRYSNFLLRFMEADGKGVANLKISKPEGAYPKEAGTLPHLKNMPVFEREIAYLQARLKKDPDDMDAALLIMDLFNVHELTDSGEVWAQQILKKKPQSALWLSLLSEALIRSHQLTRGQEFAKAAYRNSPLCAIGWELELNRLANSAGPEAVLDFIAKSPESAKKSKLANMISMRMLGQLGRRDEALKIFTQFESGSDFDEEIAALLAAVYSNQGRKKEAVNTWKKYLEHGRLSFSSYKALADIYLNAGDLDEAVELLKKGSGYLPENPNFQLILANVFLHQKKYSEAEKYLAQGLSLAPFNSTLLGIKGTLTSLQGNSVEAQKVLKQSIESNYNDFPSWDKLRKIEGRPAFESLATLPNLDSLIRVSKGWEGLKRERGAILTYIEDLFFYPSRAVRHRSFLVAHLPTQEAVNYWKQYTIYYNSSYQTLGITKAVSHKASGAEVDAEVAGQSLVFKSLEPGDCIVLEWTLKDDYDGEMARQAWGRFDFNLGLPVFDSRLRLFMAGPDTIGYTVRGQAVKKEVEDQVGLRMRSFSRGPYTVPVTERFLPNTETTNPDVLYSTFSNWGQISNWYANLTENKTAPVPNLRRIADSIFTGALTDSAKVDRVHAYIIANISYSSLPFRQSGWIPQSSQEVLASRLGDCKDMAALAKSLLDLVGMESHLVLVATRDEFGIRPGPIGPHFNHCILSFTLNGKERFVDLTDPQLHWTVLPRGDQGALALVIKPGNPSLINLPMDSASARQIKRKIQTVLSDSGSAEIKVRTVRTGVFARNQRSGYRSLSPEERNQEMARGLADDYADITLDTLWFGNLEPTNDSIEYGYTFRGKQAVKTSGPTHIFSLYMPDKLSNDDIPDSKPKPEGVDMNSSWYSLGSYTNSGTVTFPSHWKLLNLPESVHLKTNFGDYSLTFTLKGHVLSYARKTRLFMTEIVPSQQTVNLRDFLNQVVKNDDVQLVFSGKAK